MAQLASGHPANLPATLQPPGQTIQPSAVRAADAVWMAVAFLLGLYTRLLHLQHKPLWLDEVLTFHRIHLGARDVIADSFANRHMPSYFLIVRWVAQLGDDAATLRLPSVVFGALAVVVIYDIGRRIGGRTAGILAALLMALSPQQVQYGQEARSYALETLLITIALWGVVRLARAYDAPSLPSAPVPPVGARLGWAAYLLGTFGALDVLGGAAPWLAAANLSFYLIWRRAGEHRRALQRAWLCVHGLIAALCLPLYALLMRAGDGHMVQKFDWVPKLSWHGVWVSFASAYLMRASAVVHLDLLPTTVPLLPPVVAILSAVGLWRMRKRLEGQTLLLAFAVLPVFVLIVSVFKPVLVPRYILWSAAPFFVLAGLGAAAIPRRIAPIALGALAFMAATNLAPFYHIETKPRWDLAAAKLSTEVKPRDTVLTSDPNAADMLLTLQPKGKASIASAAMITPSVEIAVARWKQGGRVWAVHGRSGMGEREKLVDFKSRIAALGAPIQQIPLGEEITILLFPSVCPQPAPLPVDQAVSPPVTPAIAYCG